MLENTTEISGDEVSVPPESLADRVDTSSAQSGEKGDFDSLFDKAATQTAEPSLPEPEAIAEPDTFRQPDDEPDAETDPDSATAEDEEKEADEPESKETEKEKSDKSEDKSEEKESKDEKPSRVDNYKKLQERTTAAEKRVETLNGELEQFGGIEAVEDVMKFFKTAMDTGKPEQFVAEIENLPHGSKIEKMLFDKNIGIPANRIYAVNNVLKGDFGLEKALSPELMEKAFIYITAKANEDSEDLATFLDYELSYLKPDDQSELDLLKAENERLKNPEPSSDSAKENTRDLSDVNVQIEIGQQAQASFAEFEDAMFAEVSQPELKTYGLDVSAGDPADVKLAKESLAEMLKWGVIGKSFQSDARTNVANLMVEKLLNGESSMPETVFERQAKRNFRNVMRVNTQTLVKNLSALLSRATNNAQPNPDKTREKLDAGIKPQSGISRQPKQKGEKDFDSLWETARADK